MKETNNIVFVLDDTARVTKEQDVIIDRLIAEGKEDKAREYLDAIMDSWQLPEEERPEIPVPG